VVVSGSLEREKQGRSDMPVYKILVQNPRDLSKFYTCLVSEDELRRFWRWWRTEVKAKRAERER